MRRFVISDRFTVSDIGLDAEGETLSELFAAAMEGMFVIILGAGKTRQSENCFSIALTSGTLEQLLVDWLSELIYRFDAEGQIPIDCHLDISSGDREFSATGIVHFRAFKRGQESADHEIKAVTYHKLQIVESEGMFGCHVVFDL